jgi:6-phosphogluconolactonase
MNGAGGSGAARGRHMISAASGAANPDEPEVVVVADLEALADVAAERVVGALAEAVVRRGRADIALTGGSTAALLYRRLVASPPGGRVPWELVHLWWGDDRFVPRDDARSNVFVADAILLDPLGAGIPIAASHVHPWPVDSALARVARGDDPADGHAWCARTYAAEARAALPAGPEGWPAFDLVLLGIGGDGHLLSVFPGSAAIGSPELTLAIPAPTHIEPHVPRVTFNPAILGSAARILALVSGAAKADVVARVLAGPRDPTALPGVLARRATATWLLDAAAAGALQRD